MSVKSYTYEPGGKPASQTNALGGVTRTTYTSTGLPLTQSNPDGTTQSWLYLVDGRLSKETYANGSSRTVTYDDANRSVTSTLRDSANNVLSTELQNFDRRGNALQKTDAEGYVSTTTYDALNRSKVVTGPLAVSNSGAQKVTRVYDAAGLWQLDINALGEQTLTTFDAEGRPLTVELKNSNGASVRSTAYQYSADHHSVTTVQGTTGMQSTTFMDLQGKPVITRNAVGGAAVSRYDVAGNLTSSTDELNRTTRYTYDALNRLIQQALPDGAATKFVYDAGGNLLQRQMRQVSPGLRPTTPPRASSRRSSSRAPRPRGRGVTPTTRQALALENWRNPPIYTEVNIRQLQEVHWRCHPAWKLE